MRINSRFLFLRESCLLPEKSAHFKAGCTGNFNFYGKSTSLANMFPILSSPVYALVYLDG